MIIGINLCCCDQSSLVGPFFFSDLLFHATLFICTSRFPWVTQSARAAWSAKRRPRFKFCAGCTRECFRVPPGSVRVPRGTSFVLAFDGQAPWHPARITTHGRDLPTASVSSGKKKQRKGNPVSLTTTDGSLARTAFTVGGTSTVSEDQHFSRTPLCSTGRENVRGPFVDGVELLVHRGRAVLHWRNAARRTC